MFAKTRRKKNSSKRSYYHDRDLLCGRKQLLIWLINLDDCVKSNNYIKGISWLEQSARIIEILSKDCKQSSEYFWNQYSIIHWNLANSLHNFDMQSNGGFIFENWKIQLKKIEMIRFETKSMQFIDVIWVKKRSRLIIPINTIYIGLSQMLFGGVAVACFILSINNAVWTQNCYI